MTLSLDRRSFLKVAATAAGGLLVSIYVDADPDVSAVSSFAPNGFVRIDPDGTVVIFQKSPDMGQGVKTSMPMIVADELDADWANVRVEQAPLDPAKYGGQGSGGSDNIMSDWLRLRQAGATARALLMSAAAVRWETDRSRLHTEAGFVVHAQSGAKLAYGELAANAAEMPVPSAPIRLKEPGEFRIVGTAVRGVDTPAIVRGQPLYGLDVRISGMLFAAILHSPVFGGAVRAVDDAATLKIPGVRRVVSFGGHKNPTFLRGGVAVVADSTWAAFQGRKALVVDWDEGKGRAESTERLESAFREALARPGTRLRESGDVDSAIASARRSIDVLYEGPFLAHATLEPQNCTAEYLPGGESAPPRCDVWGPMQMPNSAQTVVAEVTGLAPAQVTIHMTRIGGGFGRRLLSDYAAEAAVVSKLIGAPVQIVWPRDEDLSQDYYRPSNAQRVRAAVDDSGRVVAWDHAVAGVSRNTHRLGNPAEATEIYGLFAPWAEDNTSNLAALLRPVAVPNVRLQFTEIPTTVPSGAWRAPSHNIHAFVIESAIDELAVKAHLDPIDVRLRLLGDASDLRVKEPSPTQYNPDRLKRVLLEAAERAGWRRGAPDAAPIAGRARGIACHFTFSGYSAQVVEIRVSGNRIVIDRIIAVLDVGTPINPLGLEAQTQGGILDGLGAAMYGKVVVKNGRAQPKSFGDYRLLRHDEAPGIEVHIVPSTQPPCGYGEIALPPLAPALGNAIYAATGRRIRRLPFALSGFTL